MTEMTTGEKGREAALFLQLLLGLQQAAMVALGKLMNPVTGKIERNLEAARNTIDTLSAIAQKHYGKASKYMKIFEANRPMLKDPDKIYPGQNLRIPPR